MIECPACGKYNEGDRSNYNWNEIVVCDFCGTEYAEETCYDTDMSEGADYSYTSYSYEMIVRTFNDNLAITTNFNRKKIRYDSRDVA